VSAAMANAPTTIAITERITLLGRITTMTFNELLDLESEDQPIMALVSDALDKNDHADDDERRILALYEFFEGDVALDDISDCGDHRGMPVYDAGCGEYAVATDSEAEDAQEAELEDYIDDCILCNLEGIAAQYFDREAWKRDARFDGRGHHLSSYDGVENESREFFIYRVN